MSSLASAVRVRRRRPSASPPGLRYAHPTEHPTPLLVSRGTAADSTATPATTALATSAPATPVVDGFTDGLAERSSQPA